MKTPMLDLCISIVSRTLTLTICELFGDTNK